MKTVYFNFKFLMILALSAMVFASCSEDDVAPEPAADFAFEKNELTVTFLNTSENADSYMWDFGDGETSEQEHPSHTYEDGGIYEVELTATGEGGSNVTTQEVTVVPPQPSGGFLFTPNELEVSFESLLENADSFVWDFGVEGTEDDTSTDENPTYTYTEPGTYTVTLTGTGGGGETTVTEPVTVVAMPTGAITPTAEGLTVTFDSAIEYADSYMWDFGVEGVDDDTSTEEDPAYTYPTGGEYTVTLVATGDGGSVTVTEDIAVVAPEPTGTFTPTAEGLAVTFDSSIENATSYEWDFGVDGTDEDTSTEEDPTYTYSEGGDYTVTLIATGDGGTFTVTDDISVVAPEPTGTFTPVADGLSVTFENSIEFADSYAWDFGVDGTEDDTSTDEDPTYTYAQAGTYNVSVTATGPGGDFTFTVPVTVTAGGTTDPDPDPDPDPSGVTIVFIQDAELEDPTRQFIEDRFGAANVIQEPSQPLSSASADHMELLNSADLVIIGRTVASDQLGNDNPADADAWDDLTTPVMLLQQYSAREERMGWFDGDNEDNRESALIMAVIESSDAVFNDVSGTEDNLIPWLTSPSGLLVLDTPTNGEVLAKAAPGNAGLEEGEEAVLFVRFEPLVAYYEGSPDIPQAPRTFFGWGHDRFPGKNYFGQLSEEAKATFLNEIERLVNLDY